MKYSLPLILAAACVNSPPQTPKPQTEILEASPKQLEQTLQKTPTVIVEFYMPSCGPCKPARAILHEYLNQGPIMMELDIIKHEDAQTKFQVYGTPTIVFYNHGKESCRIVGYLSESFFRENLNQCNKTFGK